MSAMAPPVPELIRTKNFEALSGLIQARWGTTPTTQSLAWLHEIVVVRRSPPAGGTPEAPWSESTWLLWIKNRLDEYAARPECAEDPGEPYGAVFDVEREPTNPVAWRSFLARYSKELLAEEDLDLWAPVPDEARESGWMGFDPAGDAAIQAAEARIGRRLPASLRCFYSVSNGWRATGRTIYEVLPVEEIGWLIDREALLYGMAVEAESMPGPFKDDPGDARLKQYRDDDGTRVKRSLAISSQGDNGAIWLLDPGAEPHPDEWPAGEWNQGMRWEAANFAVLMANELRSLIELRDY